MTLEERDDKQQASASDTEAPGGARLWPLYATGGCQKLGCAGGAGEAQEGRMREREGRGGGGGGGGGEGEEEKEKGAPPATIGGARFGAAEWQQVQIRDFDCGGPARAGRVTSWRTRESGGAELAQEEAAAAACIGRVAPPRQPPFAPAALVATTMAATRSSGHDGGGQDEQVAAQTNARLRANNKLATSREELEEGKGRGDEEPDQAGREREKQRRAASSASPTDASDDAPPPPLASAPASAPVVAETTKELEQLLQRRRSPEELGRPLQSGPRRAQLVDGPRERRRQQQQQQHSTSATLRRLLAHIDREATKTTTTTTAVNTTEPALAEPQQTSDQAILKLKQKQEHDEQQSFKMIMDNLDVINAPNQGGLAKEGGVRQLESAFKLKQCNTDYDDHHQLSHQKAQSKQRSDGELSSASSEASSSLSSVSSLELLANAAGGYCFDHASGQAKATKSKTTETATGPCSALEKAQMREQLLLADLLFEPSDEEELESNSGSSSSSSSRSSSSSDGSAGDRSTQSKHPAKRFKQSSETSVLLMMQHLTRRRNELKVIDERLLSMMNSCLTKLDARPVAGLGEQATPQVELVQQQQQLQLADGGEQQVVAIDLSTLSCKVLSQPPVESEAPILETNRHEQQPARHAKKMRLLEAIQAHQEVVTLPPPPPAAVPPPQQQQQLAPMSWIATKQKAGQEPLSLVIAEQPPPQPAQLQHQPVPPTAGSSYSSLAIGAEQPPMGLQYSPQLLDYFQRQLSLTASFSSQRSSCLSASTTSFEVQPVSSLAAEQNSNCFLPTGLHKTRSQVGQASNSNQPMMTTAGQLDLLMKQSFFDGADLHNFNALNHDVNNHNHQSNSSNNFNNNNNNFPHFNPMPIAGGPNDQQQQQQQQQQQFFGQIQKAQQHQLQLTSDLILPMVQKMSSFRCHVCQSCFEDRHRLQQHLSIHLNLHPSWFEERTIKETMAQYELRRGDYLCQICQLRYETTAEFDKHMQLHGEKPHQCELCQQANNKLVSFRYFRQLLTHLRSHCFLYTCKFTSECKQTANRKDYLKLHILKHHLNNKLPEQHTICCH